MVSCLPNKQDILLEHHFSSVSGEGEDQSYMHYVYAKNYHPKYHNKKYLIGLAQQYLDSVDVERRNDKPVSVINFINSTRYFEKSYDNDWLYIEDNYVFFTIFTERYKDYNKIDTTKGIDYYPNRYSCW